MAFRYSPKYKERIYYTPANTRMVKLPRGNLYAGINLFVQAEVDIGVGGAADVPSFQIARMIRQLRLMRGSETVWQLSGEALAVRFLFKNGVAAIGNTEISGAAGNNKLGQIFLKCSASPDDAAVPTDYLIDTRAHEYELHVDFRDISTVGTFFGTHTGAVTALDAENYIEVELEQLDLTLGPNGAEDKLAKQAPLMMGLYEQTFDITQSNSQFVIQLQKFKTYRNLYLFATHEAAANQVIGSYAVLNNQIEVKDSQDQLILRRTARMVREDTSQRWGVSSMNDGVYHLNLLRYGNTIDAIRSDGTNELFLVASVAKLANATAIRVISETVERQ